MRFAPRLPLFLTLAIAVAALPATAAGRPLAWVDGQPITGEDLEKMFSAQHMGHDSFLIGLGEVQAALEKLVDRTLLLQEAERMDLASRPVIQAGIDDLITRLAVQHLIRTEIEDAAQPGEEAIRAAYDRFTGHLLIVRQIVVPERSEIDEIAALLQAGEPFAELARKRSRVKSSQAGGLLPPIGWGTMETAWDDVAFAMDPGEISSPFASGGAWEILLLEERRPVQKPDYMAARPELESILLKRGLDARERAFSDRLHEKYKVVIKISALDPDACAALMRQDPHAVVAAWKGGELQIGELAGRGDFGALEMLTDKQAIREMEERLRTSITRHLIRLEAQEEKLFALPEIQAEARNVREQAVLAILHDEFIFKDLSVSDADVKRWHELHQDEVQTSEKRFVSQIVLPTLEEARATALRLAEGVPFADLAREISVDKASAEKGGALGWITREESPAGFEAVFSLSQGEVTEPVQTSLGWHLIRVLEIQPAEKLTLDEAGEKIRAHLEKTGREERRQKWLAQLRAAAEIKIDDAAVRSYAEQRSESSH